jgi:hydroxymethylbilane synthase
MTVTALVAMPDGSRAIRDSVSGAPDQAEALGEQLAARLLASGADEILAASAADG